MLYTECCEAAEKTENVRQQENVFNTELTRTRLGSFLPKNGSKTTALSRDLNMTPVAIKKLKINAVKIMRSSTAEKSVCA